MKKILVTGGAGFIGHHFINYILSNTDWNITSIDRLDFSGNLNRLTDIIEENNNTNNAKKRESEKIFLNLKFINSIIQITYFNKNFNI